MIPLFKFHGMLSGGGKLSLLQAIEKAALTTNCKLILDAGDAASYSSGQSWLDRSGNGYDFFRGDTSGSETTDPTFNGLAGGLSANEYWSFDGLDYFTYDAANETWMDTLHKDGAVFSLIAAVWVPALSSNHGLFGTAASDADIGIGLRINPNEKLQVNSNNATPPGTSKVADTALSQSAWHIVGLSLSENGGSVSFLYTDGNYSQVGGSNTFDAAYTSPSSSNASHTMQIGATGNANNRLGSGTRLGFFGIWQGTALTKANFDTLYASLKGRYGLA